MDDKFIVLKHSFIRDQNLTMQEKIVYLEILNLSSLDKGCIASNSHFEKCFGISKKSVSNTISSLISKGYIESTLSDRNHIRVLSIKDGQVSIKDGQVSIKDGQVSIKDGQVSIKDGQSKENIKENIKENKDATLVNEFSKAYGEPNEKALEAIKRFLIHRRSIKKNVKTIKPIKLFLDNLRECLIAKYSIDEVFELMEAKEWQSINLEWVQKSLPREKEWGEK